MSSFSLLSWVINGWTLLIGLAIFAIYKWGMAKFDYFKDRGVPFKKPVAIFGNSLDILMGKDHMIEVLQMYYNRFKGELFYGVYDMRDPVIVIRDPEMVKQLTVKDFEHFVDRRVVIDEKMEPIFAKNLLSLTGQRWKNMRATLSPVFTGSKMREMFDLMMDCGQQTSNYLLELSKDMVPLVIDTKDLSTRFTNDVIASCAFGLEVNSLKDKENEFFLMGRTITNFSKSAILKMTLIAMFPKICTMLKMRVFPKELSNRFSEIVLETIAHREKNNIVRRDVIELLMQARAGSLKHTDSSVDKHNDGFATVQESSIGLSQNSKDFVLDNEDLIAQCLIFFFAGFETSSVLMCFCIQELIENPDVQEKLLAEVDDVQNELNGKPLTYEALQKIKYLDMVISETLRKWPNAPITDRICTKPLEVDNKGRKYRFEVNDRINLNIIGIHRDPEYYPDPLKFDPERFSDENKSNIKQFTYMPFGTGPRNCIGSRFALLESKAFIYYLLANFTLRASEKTTIPITTESLAQFKLQPKNGFWVELEPRK